MMQDASPLPHLHHITAIASGAQQTVDFYTHVLGLHLVKRTVTSTTPTRITSTSPALPTAVLRKGVTGPYDRRYFRSIYFTDPGGPPREAPRDRVASGTDTLAT